MLFASGLGAVPANSYKCAGATCKASTAGTKDQFVELQKLIQATAQAAGLSVRIVPDGALGPATFAAFRKLVESDRFPWNSLPYDAWYSIKQQTTTVGALVQNLDVAMQALRAAGLILIAKGYSSSQPSVAKDPPLPRAPVTSSQSSQVATTLPEVKQGLLPSMAIGTIPGWAYAAGAVGLAALLGVLAITRKRPA